MLDILSEEALHLPKNTDGWLMNSQEGNEKIKNCMSEQD